MASNQPDKKTSEILTGDGEPGRTDDILRRAL